jgi:hypothetical protein
MIASVDLRNAPFIGDLPNDFIGFLPFYFQLFFAADQAFSQFLLKKLSDMGLFAQAHPKKGG